MRSSSPGARGPTSVHPSAHIDPDARLGAGVVVGPWTFVGPGVRIGDGSRLGPRVTVERDTLVGEDCRIHDGAVLGSDPQDLKFRGERTTLEVGDRTTVREFATINRGTAASGRTVVGPDCVLMAYVHVAHDCRLGAHVVLANAVNMGGHVEIGDWAIVGGLTPIHQWVRIGAHAFVGGGSRISQDVLPYCRVAGNPPRMFGLNAVGLDRRGFPDGVRQALKRAYRVLFQSQLRMNDALERVEREVEDCEEVRRMVEFVRASQRGITV